MDAGQFFEMIEPSSLLSAADALLDRASREEHPGTVSVAHTTKRVTWAGGSCQNPRRDITRLSFADMRSVLA
eukprot:10371830-Alexandrium_andersonii.AAC.1